MTSQRAISVGYKNNLLAYFGDWRMMMSIMRPEEPEYSRFVSIPAVFQSFSSNTYDFSLMLAYLDGKLTLLEETPLTPSQFNYQAYAEARAFLKTSYLLLRILLDDISGIIEYFYKKNEPRVEVKKSFDDLLKKAKKGGLPEGLSILLERSGSWFPEMRKRRVNLEHHYESMIITFERGEGGKRIPGHFGTKGRISIDYGDIRKYFGFVLCEYQTLIDNLLDHFDTKFNEWYGFKPHRVLNIIEGCGALPLWWAYKYGNYRHKDLQVSEGNTEAP